MFKKSKTADKRFSKFRAIPVKAVQSELFKTTVLFDGTVLSDSPAAALALVRAEIVEGIAGDTIEHKPVEFVAIGPKGGKYERFMGWDSLMYEMLCLNRSISGIDHNIQPELFSLVQSFNP